MFDTQRLRAMILTRIKEIKKTEQDFKIPYYKNNYISYFDHGVEITKHISEVDFVTDITDEHDLIRLFECIIRVQEGRMETMIIK